MVAPAVRSWFFVLFGLTAVLLLGLLTGCNGSDAGRTTAVAAITQPETTAVVATALPDAAPTPSLTPSPTAPPTFTPAPAPNFIRTGQVDYSAADLAAAQALQAVIATFPVASDTTLYETVRDGNAFMEIVSGQLEYNGHAYPPGTRVMLSPVAGYENQLLFFTPDGAAAAAAQAGMELSPQEVDFTFVGSTPATKTREGNLIRINPDNGQWEAIVIYRAADLTFGRSHLAPVNNPDQSLVEMIHSTRIDYRMLPGYVTITSKAGDQLVLATADFHQLAESRWQSVDMQPTIDAYARHSQSTTVDVNGIPIPITISHGFDQYTMTADEQYLQDLALHWLHATWLRYRISNPDVTFEEYQEEVRQGRGQVVAPVNYGGSRPFIIVNPTRGLHFVLAHTTDTLPNRSQGAGTADNTAVFTAHWAGARGITSVYNANNFLFSNGIESGINRYGFTRVQALAQDVGYYIFVYGVDDYVNFPAAIASGRSFQHGLDLRYRRYVADYLVSRYPQASEAERNQMQADWFAARTSKDQRDRWWQEIVSEGHYPYNGVTFASR
jgi:hypothetical protein